MFGHTKHVYTCPDSIHDRKVAKRRVIAIYGTYATVLAAGLIAGKIQDRKDRKAAYNINIPTI